MGLTAQRDVNVTTEVSAIHAMDAAPVSTVGSDQAVDRGSRLVRELAEAKGRTPNQDSNPTQFTNRHTVSLTVNSPGFNL